MKIVALYKVWSGEEWLIPSVLSIYDHVEKIVLLTSDISWIGGRGNPSLKTIKTLLEHHDDCKKVIHINHDEPNQIKHCQWGYEWIKENEPCDFIQLIDSDELWDNENYELAKKHLINNHGFDAYRTNMYTYVKNVKYRIEPPEPLKPVCFISTKRSDMGLEPRGCGINPYYTMTDVWCHHYVFVRQHFNAFLEKLIQSHVSEKQPYEQMDKWISQVWANLPNVPESWTKDRGGFHPAIGYGKNWKSVREIGNNELPSILRHSRFPDVMRWGK